MKLADLSVQKLKELCRTNGVKGFSTLGKDALVKLLRKNVGGRVATENGTTIIKKKNVKGTGVIAVAEGTGDSKNDVSDRLRSLVDKLKGGSLQKSQESAPKDSAAKEDSIDWDDIKWGSFTQQLKRYNETHDNKFEGDKALCRFAEMIMQNKSKFSTTTQRRASFYLNVLAKKKCS
tara:strand:- start:6020 stop:6550 length:531 start_codon:yes stop_codon:yes gene_type:complete